MARGEAVDGLHLSMSQLSCPEVSRPERRGRQGELGRPGGSGGAGGKLVTRGEALICATDECETRRHVGGSATRVFCFLTRTTSRAAGLH